MITFISEAKTNAPNPARNNGLQNSLEITRPGNGVYNKVAMSQVSQPSPISAMGAAAIPQVSLLLNVPELELERRMCLERLPFLLDVSLFNNDEHIGSGTICNVGGRGMFVETSATLKKGAPLQLCFTLMGNARLPTHRVVGRVAHVTSEGVGVHLDVLKRDTMTGLQALKKQAGRAHRS